MSGISWQTIAAVGILQAVVPGQRTREITALVERLGVAAERDAAEDALVELGERAVPALVAKIEVLEHDQQADTAMAICAVVGGLGEHGVAAGAALLNWVGEEHDRRVFDVAVWAIAQTLRHATEDAGLMLQVRANFARTFPNPNLGRVLFDERLWRSGNRAGDRLEAGQIELLRATLEERATLDEADGPMWLLSEYAAIHIAAASAAAPDLERALRRRFDLLFATRSDPHGNQFGLVEFAAGMRRLSLTPVDTLRADIAGLRHPIARERRLRVIALQSQGPLVAPYVRDLLACIADPDAGVRRETVRTLGCLGLAGAALRPRLRNLADDDGDPEVRRIAGGAHRAIETTCRAAHGPAAEVVAWLAAEGDARARLGATLQPDSAAASVLAGAALAETDWQRQVEILDLMAKAGPRAVEQVPALLQVLALAAPEVAEATMTTLAALGPAARTTPNLRADLEFAAMTPVVPALPAMSEALAAILLDRSEPRRLIPYLGDANPLLRLRAIWALDAAAVPPEAIEALTVNLLAPPGKEITIACAMRRTHSEVLVDEGAIPRAAARVLVKCDVPAATRTRAVCLLLDSDEREDKLVALHDGVRHPLPSDAIGLVIACLRNPDDEMALAAIAAVGQSLDARAALPTLREMASVDDAVGMAAAAAARAIEHR